MTAMFTFEQVKEIVDIVECDTLNYFIILSRIADTGESGTFNERNC